MNKFPPTPVRLSRLLVALAVVCLASEPACSLAAESGNESIGNQLLDDLDPSLFGPPPTQSENPPGRSDAPKRILPGVTDDALGEDIGQRSPNEPLLRVERNMQTAAELIAESHQLSRAGDVQRQVVADLDKLIEELSKQCCGGASKPGEQSKQGSQRSQANNKKAGPKPGRGNSPARDSTSGLRPADPRAVNLADREELMKDLWGHLPPQIREQMLQSYSDEFLPEYEIEIEKYFRRLAEEQAKRHTQ